MHNQMRLFFRCAWLIIICGCLLIGVNAQQTFIVDRTDDDGTFSACVAGTPNDCTLRGAIAAANSDTTTQDTINFSPTVFQSGNTITLNSELTILGNLIVAQDTNATAPVIISGGTNTGGVISRNTRIFTVSAGVSLTLTRLKLNYGNGSGVNSGNGGAILNNGTLSINQSTISDNTASQGGGVYNNGGVVTLDRSTISANVAGSGGGGVYNFNGTTGRTGSVTLTNATISGNSGGVGFGGGYFGFSSDGTTSLMVTNATIAGNSAANGGGIAVSSISGATSTASLSNTIVGDNTANASADDNDGPDVFNNPTLILPPPLNTGTIVPGAITSSGYNLIEVTTGSGIIINPLNDRTGDPKLITLADNGFVFAPTHALRNTTADKSPAIDAGKTSLTTDQRGFARDIDIPGAPDPSDSDNINDDIGAFEVQLGATAATVSVNGRVMLPSRRGIARARVTLTDQSGQTRTAMTNFFGYFRFKEVSVGETYVFDVSSKSHSFNPRVITITENLTELNFIAEP